MRQHASGHDKEHAIGPSPYVTPGFYKSLTVLTAMNANGDIGATTLRIFLAGKFSRLWVIPGFVILERDIMSWLSQ